MTLNQIKALRCAADVLADGIRECADLIIGDRLPPKHHHRYNAAFYRKIVRSSKALHKRLTDYLTSYERALQKLASRPDAPDRDSDAYWDGFDGPTGYVCKTVAEELILNLMVEDAHEVFMQDPEHRDIAGVTEEEAGDDDLGAYGLLFEDCDFELLYDGAQDGVESEDSPAARQLCYVNLEFKDWFKCFHTSGSKTK